MARFHQELEVYANPYAGASLDHEGRGHAHATYFGQGPEAIIGGRADAQASRDEDAWILNFDRDEKDPTGRRKVKLVCAGVHGWAAQQQYLENIEEETLIAANELTAYQANKVLLSPEGVKAKIEADRKRAIAEWRAHGRRRFSDGSLTPRCDEEDHAHGGVPPTPLRSPARRPLAPGEAPPAPEQGITLVHVDDAGNPLLDKPA